MSPPTKNRAKTRGGNTFIRKLFRFPALAQERTNFAGAGNVERRLENLDQPWAVMLLRWHLMSRTELIHGGGRKLRKAQSSAGKGLSVHIHWRLLHERRLNIGHHPRQHLVRPLSHLLEEGMHGHGMPRSHGLRSDPQLSHNQGSDTLANSVRQLRMQNTIVFVLTAE